MKGTEITGLWVETDMNGNKYLTAKLGRFRIRIIKNGFKDNDKKPDWVMYLEPEEK